MSTAQSVQIMQQVWQWRKLTLCLLIMFKKRYFVLTSIGHALGYYLRGEEKDYRTSYIRPLLSDEFGEEIGFQNHFQKNESTLVYDRSNGGTFLEYAVNSWGLNIEDLLRNVARQINTEINKLPQMPWPHTVKEVYG